MNKFTVFYKIFFYKMFLLHFILGNKSHRIFIKSLNDNRNKKITNYRYFIPLKKNNFRILKKHIIY
jgi:hypothetical protein